MSTATIFHVTGPFSSSYFEDLARWHDPRFRMHVCAVGSLDPIVRARLEALGVRTWTLGAVHRRHYPAAAARLARILRQERPDILETHLFEPSIVGQLVAAVVRGSKVRIIARHHADAHHVAGKRVHVWIDRMASMMAHHVVANSEWTRSTLLREGVAPEKISVVQLGIDIAQFDRACERTAPLATELSLPGDRPVIVSVGRLHPEKGQQVLLEAVSRVRDAAVRPPLVLLAGDGPSRSLLEQLVHERRLTNVVRLLGHRQDVPALLGSADLVVVPSLGEALGQAVIEAMAAGCAVVASATGGIPELIEHDVTGVLVVPGDADELAGAILTLLADGGRRRQLGARARARVEEALSAESMVRSYEAVYDEQLAERKCR